MEKKNRKSTLALWGILITAGLVLAGIELLSGVKHWSVIPTGKGAIDQAISPDESLLVVLNAGENSLSFIDLKTKIPFNKLYLPLEALVAPAEGEMPSYVLSSIEFSGDGSELLVTCVDGRFFVIDPVLQEVKSTGKALEPGLTLLGKGKVGKGVFALDRAIGKLSLLGASGEVPVVLTRVPLVASAIDFRPKTTCGTCREFLVTFAYQVEGSGRLSLVEVDSSTLDVTQELSMILPAGATFGDIRRGDEGSIVSVTYLDGSFDFLWVNNDGTIEEQEGEPLPGPEGEKIFRLCKSGMYLAHLNKGLFTLLTYDKDAKPLRLDMAPGGFDGAELRSMSAYPEQADSFASAIGPHEMLLGVPGWEGVVVFDSSGQSILGFGNNNNTYSCNCSLRVQDDEELWYFCGLSSPPGPPAYYKTEVTVACENTCIRPATYTWTVTTGCPGIVKIKENDACSIVKGPEGNKVKIYSTGASSTKGDVTIECVVTSFVPECTGATCSMKLTVLKPSSIAVEHVGCQDIHELEPEKTGYICMYRVFVFDQFEFSIPRPLEINETWQSRQNKMANDWPNPPDGSFTTGQSGLPNCVFSEGHGVIEPPSLQPHVLSPTPPHSKKDEVYTIIQCYYAGSHETGKGCQISAKTIWYCLRHGWRTTS